MVASLDYFWLGYNACQISDGDEVLLVPSCWEMQSLEEDSEEHRTGLFIPAPVQGGLHRSAVLKGWQDTLIRLSTSIMWLHGLNVDGSRL